MMGIDTKLTGSQILARSLRRQQLSVLFYIMGGPMLEAEASCIEEGLRTIDVRHEAAAVMMAQAYGRVTGTPAVCMAASGPGMANLIPGLANALADCSPVVAIGGSSPISQRGRGVFQEIDQVALAQPVTKWAERVYEASRIPELVHKARKIAVGGCPGPVYLDLPFDVLSEQVSLSKLDVRWDVPARPGRSGPDPVLIEAAISLLEGSSRPIILSGSGLIWSDAQGAMQEFAQTMGIPIFTTPQGRGAIPEDHSLAFPAARSFAFEKADVVLVVGTRLNYVVSHVSPPRFRADAVVVQVDIEEANLGSSRSVDVGIQADARAALMALLAAARGRVRAHQYSDWRDELNVRDSEKKARQDRQIAGANGSPIHPLRLCGEVRDFLGREDILVVDGQEILTYARQSIPTYTLGRRINSGAFGTMGVGLPYGIGAKVGKPENDVVVLHGDGSLGFHTMEMDTAVRHNIPVVLVVSLNGGHTSVGDGNKPGRDLGYTRYDEIARALGGHGEFVRDPLEIGPALKRARTSGRFAIVNVRTDETASAPSSVEFAAYST